MAPKYAHFMEESDIGSGEKTPAEMEDLEQTRNLREQQEQARQQARPMDGGLLQQVTEEQQFINQHESHTPHGVVEDTPADETGPAERDMQVEDAMAPKPMQKGKKADAPQGQQAR